MVTVVQDFPCPMSMVTKQNQPTCEEPEVHWLPQKSSLGQLTPESAAEHYKNPWGRWTARMLSAFHESFRWEIEACSDKKDL